MGTGSREKVIDTERKLALQSGGGGEHAQPARRGRACNTGSRELRDSSWTRSSKAAEELGVREAVLQSHVCVLVVHMYIYDFFFNLGRRWIHHS